MAFDDPDLVGRQAINSGKRRHLRVVVEIGGQRVPRENVFLGQETARYLRVNKIVVRKTEITEQTKNAFLLFSINTGRWDFSQGKIVQLTLKSSNDVLNQSTFFRGLHPEEIDLNYIMDNMLHISMLSGT